MSTLNPYINFKDQAREAITFYASVFGGEPTISTFGDFGMSVDESEKDLVMHSQLETPAGFTIMAADTPSHMEYSPGSSITVSLSGPHEDEAELRGYWEKLVEGGQVPQPLEPAPWGDVFGMATDRFGTQWLMNIAGAPREG